jgi:hypothetical protein
MDAKKSPIEVPTRKVASLEGKLSGVLRPIAARKEFVHGLSHRIQEGGRVSLVNRVANIHFLAALIAGLISLGIFLAFVAKALFSLFNKKRTA